MNEPIRIGSRGSQLALWQANHIASALREAGHTVDVEVIRTTGDRMQQAGAVSAGEVPAGGVPLDGKGIFIKEIEDALADGRIDLAVHSLKDLPTELDPRFTLAAIPARADARDVWVCEPFWALHTLPMGGRVGTTSPRRQAQLLALRPDVEFVEVRGNIDTRLRKLEAGECDALVLAAAGLDRIGRAEWVHQRFALDELTPAPGQGALALETRSPRYATFAEPERDACIHKAVAALDCAKTRFCVEVERTVLHALGGGCQLPIGVHCAGLLNEFGATVRFGVHAQVVAPDGEAMVALYREAPAGVSPATFGGGIAEELKVGGALELLAG